MHRNTSEKGEYVFITPQDVSLYHDPSKEPQYVTAVEPIESMVWIDSQNTDGLDNTQSVYHPTSGALGLNVRRITIRAIGCLWDSPNVNPRNNTLRFFSTVSGIFHTVVIPVGYYSTSASLMAAVVTAMNTVMGASGIEFLSVPIPLQPDAYTLTFDVASQPLDAFYLDPACDAVFKGEQLYNFPYQYAPVQSCRVGTMFLIYTKYIDIVSRAITKDSKMRSVTSSNISNVAIRFYTGGRTAPGDIVKYIPPSDLHFAHRSDSPIYEVDFLWLDQNGDKLYVNSPETFSWDLNLGFEG